MKILFTENYNPRKKGEVANLDTKLAEYYVSIGVATKDLQQKQEEPCTDCDDSKATKPKKNTAKQPNQRKK